MKTGNRNHRKELVERIIVLMEKAGEWNKPWAPGGLRPHNPVTGTSYRGINALALATAGFTDARFFTFNNIKQLSKKAEESGEPPIKLRKGEKGTPIFKAVKVRVGKKEDEPGETQADDSVRTIMVYVYAGTVFNAEQIDGLPPAAKPAEDILPVDRAEFAIQAMCKETGLKWEEGPCDMAAYSVSADRVQVPHRGQFKSVSEFYSTALHELGHATGHKNRLNRDMTGTRHLAAYAFEELVAEMTSYFTAYETGVPYDRATHENSAAYLKDWISGLRNDHNILFKACSMASKASDYIARIANEHRAKLADEQSINPKSMPAFIPEGDDDGIDLADAVTSDALEAAASDTSEDFGPVHDDVSMITAESAFEEFGIEITQSGFGDDARVGMN